MAVILPRVQAALDKLDETRQAALVRRQSVDEKNAAANAAQLAAQQEETLLADDMQAYRVALDEALAAVQEGYSLDDAAEPQPTNAARGNSRAAMGPQNRAPAKPR